MDDLKKFELIGQWFQKAKNGDIKPDENIFEMLESSDWNIKEYIIGCLSEIGASWGIPHLEKILAENDELQSEALQALMEIGTKDVVPIIIQGLQNEDYEVREYARIALISILSGDDIVELFDEFDDSTKEFTLVSKWWDQNQFRFDPSTCYCSGKPLNIGSLINGLQNESAEYDLSRLKFLTGINFETETTTVAIDKWKNWWKSNQSNFVVGKRYFYGHLVS